MFSSFFFIEIQTFIVDNLHSVATEKDPVFHWEYIVIVALLKFMSGMWLYDVKEYFWTKITESIERDVKVNWM